MKSINDLDPTTATLAELEEHKAMVMLLAGYCIGCGTPSASLRALDGHDLELMRKAGIALTILGRHLYDTPEGKA